MGLTIHYAFAPHLPPDLPVTDPAQARAVIRQAHDRALNALYRLNIPAAAEPLKQEPGPWRETCHQEIILSGPAEGCEPLTLGWTRHPPNPWHNTAFIKTQYAVDFPTDHAAVCAVLEELEKAGIIGGVHDEAEWYLSGRPREELAQEYGASNAVLGRIHDQLQGMLFSYEANTPGGVIKQFPARKAGDEP